MIPEFVKEPFNWLYITVYPLIILACILVLIVIYNLKGEYDYGAGLQQQCSPIFLEKERPEHNAYNAYINGAQGKLELAYKGIVFACIGLIMAIYTAWLIQKVVASCTREIDKNLLMYYREVDVTFLNKIWPIRILIPLLIALIMSGLLLAWVLGTHGSDSMQKLINISPFTSFITSLKETPVKFDEKEIETSKKRVDIFVNWIIFTIIMGGMALYNPIFKGDTDHDYLKLDAVVNIHILWVMVALLTMYIFKMIVDFQDSISYQYGVYKDKLNDAISNILNGSDDEAKKLLLSELKKNITNDEALTRLSADGNGAPIDILNDSRYSKDLYKYLMHIINNHDITTIRIPQELKPLIKPNYLGGENIIELKRAIIDTYYRHLNTSKPYITIETLREKGLDEALLPFVTLDVLLKMKTTTPSDNSTRDRYLLILNNTITNNPALKKGNPLPKNIIEIMSAGRQNTAIKDVIHKYFSTLNLIVTCILLVIAYYIYHNILHRNNLEDRLQLVALTTFVILIILGGIGWAVQLARV